jgi:hypothetical protein
VELVPLEQALGAAIGIKAAPGGFHRAHRVELAAGTAQALAVAAMSAAVMAGAARLAKRASSAAFDFRPRRHRAGRRSGLAVR